MKYYPEEANIKFDYGFAIKAVVAIAPADGQYKPVEQDRWISDVSYLTLQCAHDADVSSFLGSRQWVDLYQRNRFLKTARTFRQGPTGEPPAKGSLFGVTFDRLRRVLFVDDGSKTLNSSIRFSQKGRRRTRAGFPLALFFRAGVPASAEEREGV